VMALIHVAHPFGPITSDTVRYTKLLTGIALVSQRESI